MCECGCAGSCAVGEQDSGGSCHALRSCAPGTFPPSFGRPTGDRRHARGSGPNAHAPQTVPAHLTSLLRLALWRPTARRRGRGRLAGGGGGVGRGSGGTNRRHLSPHPRPNLVLPPRSPGGMRGGEGPGCQWQGGEAATYGRRAECPHVSTPPAGRGAAPWPQGWSSGRSVGGGTRDAALLPYWHSGGWGGDGDGRHTNA